MKNHTLLALVVSMLFSISAYSDVIKLNVPIVDESPKQHEYYHELLETALIEAGHTPILTAYKLPQVRARLFLNTGKISIYWMINSKKRNEDFAPIKVGLTNGLIGVRILFIKNGDQPLYGKVKNLDDFRNLNLIGGLGRGWYSVDVWKENGLKYKEHHGNWGDIFKMLPHRPDYDYFSRGVNEILQESKLHPRLVIEKRLTLIYDRDFRFYFSTVGDGTYKRHGTIIKGAMKKAQNSGLIARLVYKYWGDDYKTLDFDNRIKIKLKAPK